MSVNIGSCDITTPSYSSYSSNNVHWAVWLLLLNVMFLPQLSWKRSYAFRSANKDIKNELVLQRFRLLKQQTWKGRKGNRSCKLADVPVHIVLYLSNCGIKSCITDIYEKLHRYETKDVRLVSARVKLNTAHSGRCLISSIRTSAGNCS